MEFPSVDHMVDQIERIQELSLTLENVNYQIAELSRIKEELEIKLNNIIKHPDEGQKSYIYGKYKITITSGYNYTLNKEEYLTLGSRLPECFNPVKERIAYDLDKKIIKDCEKYGSNEERLLLSDIICKKPKKLHIKIGQGV